MKTIKVPYVEALDNIEIEKAAGVIEERGQCDRIEILNWPDQYPYKPITNFCIARSKNSIFIKFNVHGTMLRAIYTNDQDPVWEDSCVKFFCMPEGSNKYSNFEFNCIGTCLATSRKGVDNEVVLFSTEQMQTIKRFPSLGRRAFKEMEGLFEWELTVQIPFALIGIDPDNLPSKIKGNFYKCADGTDSIHYVTWSPIKTPKPDYHQPEFFGDLLFV